MKSYSHFTAKMSASVTIMITNYFVSFEQLGTDPLGTLREGVLLIFLFQMFMMFLSRTLRDQILMQKSKWDKPVPRNPA